MLKLCMKTLQCATKFIQFCFEVKCNSNVILKRNIIQLFNMAMSRLSKQHLAGKLAKKTLTLDEKIRFLDFTKKIQNLDVGNYEKDS